MKTQKLLESGRYALYLLHNKKLSKVERSDVCHKLNTHTVYSGYLVYGYDYNLKRMVIIQLTKQFYTDGNGNRYFLLPDDMNLAQYPELIVYVLSVVSKRVNNVNTRLSLAEVGELTIEHINKRMMQKGNAKGYGFKFKYMGRDI